MSNTEEFLFYVAHKQSYSLNITHKIKQYGSHSEMTTTEIYIIWKYEYTNDKKEAPSFKNMSHTFTPFEGITNSLPFKTNSIVFDCVGATSTFPQCKSLCSNSTALSATANPKAT